MPIDIRKRILAIILGGVVLLVVLFLLLSQKTKISPPPTSTSTPSLAFPTEEIFSDEPRVENLPAPPPPASPEERVKLYVLQLSEIFAERYLSYSNQSNNNNISDVETLATERMVTYLATQVQTYSNDYKGVSTKVISRALESFTEGQATVIIGVQQIFEEKNAPPRTEYKTGRINLIKEEQGWKVDGLFWEE